MTSALSIHTDAGSTPPRRTHVRYAVAAGRGTLRTARLPLRPLRAPFRPVSLGLSARVGQKHARTRERGREIAGDHERGLAGAEDMRLIRAMPDMLDRPED